MGKFKEGDKVVCISASHGHGYINGRVYTILTIDYGDDFINVVGLDAGMYAKRFKHIPKPIVKSDWL